MKKSSPEAAFIITILTSCVPPKSQRIQVPCSDSQWVPTSPSAFLPCTPETHGVCARLPLIRDFRRGGNWCSPILIIQALNSAMGITFLSTQEPKLSQPWVCASSIPLMLLEKEKQSISLWKFWQMQNKLLVTISVDATAGKRGQRIKAVGMLCKDLLRNFDDSWFLF